MAMLIGTYFHNMDAKGRLFMPAKLRENLGDSFMATRSVDKCIVVFSPNEFNKIAQKTKEIPLSDLPAQRFMRDFFSNAMYCEPDKQGRILLPQNLRNYIGITKEAVITGILNRVEIWAKEEYDKYMDSSKTENDNMLKQMLEWGI